MIRGSERNGGTDDPHGQDRCRGAADASHSNNILICLNRHGFTPVIPLAQVEDCRTGIAERRIRSAIRIIPQSKGIIISSVKGVADHDNLIPLLKGQPETIVISMTAVIGNNAIKAK
jgi:hypothetical protein